MPLDTSLLDDDREPLSIRRVDVEALSRPGRRFKATF